MNIVITGSGSGIGKYLAGELTRLGHTVIPLSRKDVDITYLELLQRKAMEIEVRLESVDCLIHCAGNQGPIGKTTGIETREWRNAINTNLLGTFNVVYAFMQPLLKSRRGKIMLMSGGGATSPRPNFSAYAVAKAGVVKLAECLAFEHPEMDINSIAPGPTRTKMTEAVLSAGPEKTGEEEFVRAKNFTTTGLPNVLRLVNFLLTPTSDGISGRLIAAQFDNFEKLPRGLGGTMCRLSRVEPK